MRSLNLGTAAVALLLASSSALAQQKVGIAVLVEGTVYAQRGEIYYTRARVGEAIKVNQFGQYKDAKPTPAFVKWAQNTRRHIRPYTNEPIYEGDIIQTAGDGFVKILFDDQSVMDIGPAGLAQIQKFTDQGDNRHVFLKTLYGRFRNVVAKALKGPQTYQIATPTAVMGVRGTEFLTNVYPQGEDGRTHTEVVCLHGQVSVDVAQYTDKGLVYNQPMVVNPGAVFSTEGFHGLGQKTALKPLPQDDLRTVVAKVSPHVNNQATYVGASPPPMRLPGTGVKMAFVYQEKKTPPKSNYISSFDMDHPPMDRALASPSDNFAVPHEYGAAPGAFGGLTDLRRYTGPPPIAQLPANVSHVRVNLNGI